MQLTRDATLSLEHDGIATQIEGQGPLRLSVLAPSSKARSP